MWGRPSAASWCGLVTNTLGGRGATPNSGAPTRSSGAPGKGGVLVLRTFSAPRLGHHVLRRPHHSRPGHARWGLRLATPGDFDMAKDNVDECWVGSALRTNGNGVVAEQPLDADSRTRQERRGQGVVSERQSRGSSGLPAILAAGATPGRRQSRRTGSATSAPGAVQRDWVGLVGPPNLRVRHQYPKRTRSQYVDPSSSGWLGFQTAATNGQVTQPTATPIATPIRARFIGRSVCAEGRDHPRMAAWASATFTAAPRARSGGPSPPCRPAAAAPPRGPTD